MAATVEGRQSHNFIPRFRVEPGVGGYRVEDRKVGVVTALGLSGSEVARELFELRAAVVEVEVTGLGLGLAEALEDWGAVTVVRVRS